MFNKVVDRTRSSTLVNEATKLWTVEISQVVCLVVSGEPEWVQLTCWNGVLQEYNMVKLQSMVSSIMNAIPVRSVLFQP